MSGFTPDRTTKSGKLPSMPEGSFYSAPSTARPKSLLGPEFSPGRMAAVGYILGDRQAPERESAPTSSSAVHRRKSTGSTAPQVRFPTTSERSWQTGSPLHTPDGVSRSFISPPGSPSHSIKISPSRSTKGTSTAKQLFSGRAGEETVGPSGGTEILINVRNDFISASLNPHVAKLLAKNGDTAVLFADLVYKVNRKGVLKPKVLLLTDRYLYVLHPTNYTQRLRVPIQAVDELKVSRFDDGFFAIYHASETRDQLLVSRRRAEFANSLIEARGRDGGLRVGYSSAFVQRLDVNTVREVTFYLDDEQLVHTRLVTKSTLRTFRAGDATPQFNKTP